MSRILTSRCDLPGKFAIGASFSAVLTVIAISISGLLFGFWFLVSVNPTAQFFRDGLRCVRRHPRMWVWLMIFGLAYLSFQAIQDFQFTGQRIEFNSLLYWPSFMPPSLAAAAARAWLPALELLSGLFNQAVVSFPSSAVAALLFIANWKGYQMQFLRTAKRRMGRWCLAVYPSVLVCAVAAFCKPIFSLSIYWLNEYFDGILLLRAGAIIDWLSYQFEYLFGLLIQIFLVLVTYVWIRGLSCEPGRIFEFALKRTVYSAKWIGLVLLTSLLLIHLPLLFSYVWISQQTDTTAAVVQYVDQTARPLVAVALLLFCSIQVTLILNNETLRDALQEHAQFLRRSWLRISSFLLLAGLYLFAMCWLNDLVAAGFPKYSVPNLFFAALFTFGRAFLAAWFLASWVCLYRGSQPAPKKIQF